MQNTIYYLRIISLSSMVLLFLTRAIYYDYDGKLFNGTNKTRLRIKMIVINGKTHFRLEKHFQIKYWQFHVWKRYKILAVSTNVDDLIKYLEEHDLMKK